MSVCIAIGHGKANDGAYDPGAVYKNIYEHRIAREIGRYAAEYYNANYAEKCDLINYDAEYFLTDRIRFINSKEYDFVAEIHLNSGGGSGVEVYHSVTSDSKIAAEISAAIAREFGIRDRTAKTKCTSSGSDYFAIIRSTKMKAVLVECLFIDNESDIGLILTPAGQKRMGETIASAIAKARDVSPKKGKSDPENPSFVYYVRTPEFKERSDAEKVLKKIKRFGINAFITAVKKTKDELF